MKKAVDYIGVGVGAMIFNDDGKLLLLKRGKDTRNEVGKWSIPGGGVDFGETCEDACIREIKEEFNIEVEITQMLEFIDHIILDEKQHRVSPTFIAKYISGEIKNMEPHKIDDYGWYNIDEIDEDMLTIVAKQSLNTYKKKYKNNRK